MTQASRFGPKPAATLAEPPPAGIAAPLLAWLRTQVRDGIDYDAPPDRISGGFDTQIWAFRLRDAPPPWDGPLIARVFRDGGVTQARFDAAVMRAVTDQGYPAPRVLSACTDAAVLGNAFIVMPRASGVPMISRMLGAGFRSMPLLLGRLHAQLHGLDVARFSGDVRAEGASADGPSPDGILTRSTVDMGAEVVERAQLDGLRPGLDWLRARHPGEGALAVCHGDFHPLNILVDAKRAAVLDWSNARIANPAWDVGATSALMGYAPVDLPGPLMPVIRRVRGWMLNRYLRAYQDIRPLDLARVRYYEAERLLAFVLETGEFRQAQRGVIPPLTKSTAFHDARTAAAIIARIEELTGVRVTLPGEL